MKKTTITSDRPLVKQFLMAMIEGAKMLTTDEEFALRVLSKHTRISDREVLKLSYNYLLRARSETRSMCSLKTWRKRVSLGYQA